MIGSDALRTRSGCPELERLIDEEIQRSGLSPRARGPRGEAPTAGKERSPVDSPEPDTAPLVEFAAWLSTRADREVLLQKLGAMVGSVRPPAPAENSPAGEGQTLPSAAEAPDDGRQ